MDWLSITIEILDIVRGRTLKNAYPAGTAQLRRSLLAQERLAQVSICSESPRRLPVDSPADLRRISQISGAKLKVSRIKKVLSCEAKIQLFCGSPTETNIHPRVAGNLLPWKPAGKIYRAVEFQLVRQVHLRVKLK